MAELHDDKAVQSGRWVGKNSPRHIKGVYLTLCLRPIEILAKHFKSSVLNVATVDVPGVIISLLRRPCKHELYPFGRNAIVYIGLQMVAVIHIGVGSNVVCSTELGNARASMGGTDNRTISRFFYVLNGVLSRTK